MKKIKLIKDVGITNHKGMLVETLREGDIIDVIHIDNDGYHTMYGMIYLDEAVLI